MTPRKRGARRIKPSDFVKEPARVMEANEAVTFMDSWMAAINKRNAKKAS